MPTVPPPQSPSRKWEAFTAVGSCYFVTVITTSFSLLALPAIAEEYGVTLRTVGWVVIVESLIVAAFLLPFGRLSDIVGRHRTLRVGVVLFGLGLALTGFAPSFIVLIGARIVTAFGNTLMQAVGTGILVAAFPEEQRGLALGAQTTAVAMGAALGPLLGGLLLDQVDWHVLFLCLAVLAALTLVVVHRSLGADPVSDPSPIGPFDRAGAVLAATFITVFVLALNDPFGFGLTSPLTIVGALMAAGLGFAFVRVELAHDSPMLDLRLFHLGAFRRAVIIRLLAFIASTTVLFLVPIYLIGIRQMTTRIAGVLLALYAVGMIVGAQISGRVYDRLGPRLPILVGLTMQLAVLALVATLGEGSPVALIALVTIGNGLGLGLWNVPANSVMMGAMPKTSFGVGGAFTNVTRTVGSVVGQAGATAVVAGVMAARGFDIPLGEVAETSGASGAFIEGWRATYIVAAVVTLVAIAVALRLTSGADRPTEVSR